VHRSERPATGSYALVPVEIKQKGTGHAGERSVTGNSVLSGLRCLASIPLALSAIAVSAREEKQV
jgi:hypothetical protein